MREGTHELDPNLKVIYKKKTLKLLRCLFEQIALSVGKMALEFSELTEKDKVSFRDLAFSFHKKLD